MKKSLFTVGWLFSAMLAVQGATPAIVSFDSAGQLTFREVPSASSYTVEWTTNLAAGDWSSSAPGIRLIAPQGTASQTVAVGIPYPVCYFRVVAAVTSAPPSAISSTFDVDNGGWSIVAYPFESHSPNPATSLLPFDGAFGNPPGSVRVGDVYGETGIAAPTSYLGNKSDFYGGSLHYEIFLRYTDDVTYPAVVLNGGTMSLYYETPSPLLNAWQPRNIPLSEAGWKVSGSYTDATETQFRAVLSNLVGLYIYTEWHTGPDDTSVDNVILSPP